MQSKRKINKPPPTVHSSKARMQLYMYTIQYKWHEAVIYIHLNDDMHRYSHFPDNLNVLSTVGLDFEYTYLHTYV